MNLAQDLAEWQLRQEWKVTEEYGFEQLAQRKAEWRQLAKLGVRTAFGCRFI